MSTVSSPTRYIPRAWFERTLGSLLIGSTFFIGMILFGVAIIRPGPNPMEHIAAWTGLGLVSGLLCLCCFLAAFVLERRE